MTVLDNVDSHDDKVQRVTIRKGFLRTQYTQVRQTTYSFKNKADAEQTVYIEHPRTGKEWQLFDTPEPHEVTESYWRFRFMLPAKQVSKFVVKQQHLLGQQFTLSDVSDQQLAFWISQRYLDAAAEKLLRKVVDLRQQAAGIEAQITRLEKEREAIHAEQKRIRENLGALGDRPSEKDLRERFVRTLNVQEDRLEAIDRELRQRQDEREKCRDDINAALAGLEYEAKL